MTYSDPSYEPPEVLPPTPEPEPTPPPQIRIALPQVQPIVTYALIGVTVVIFLIQQATQSFMGLDIPAQIGIKYNPYIDQGQFWRLITPIFLHGSIMHIGFNMYAVYILGRELERFYGHFRFFLLYLAGGFAGVVASYLLTSAPSLGASTSTFGLLAAYGVLAYRNKRIFGSRSQQVLRNIIQVAVLNFLIGLSPGIDNWAHLGGALGGIGLAWFGGPVLNVGGEVPLLKLEDKRPMSQFLLAFVGVILVFSSMALLIGGAGL